jgi:hypothetical protein
MKNPQVYSLLEAQRRGCLHLLIMAACLVGWATLHQTAQGASLQNLIDGASLNVGATIIHDWELVSLDFTATQGPDLSQIEILPLGADPLAPGFHFIANNQLATAGVNSIDMTLRFRVSPMPSGPVINGDALELTGFAFGGDMGIVMISDEIADGTGNDLGAGLVIANNEFQFFTLTDATNFSPQSEIVVTKNLFVTGLSESDTVSLDVFNQRFFVVPEPATILLALTAMPSLVFRLRVRLR